MRERTRTRWQLRRWPRAGQTKVRNAHLDSPKELYCIQRVNMFDWVDTNSMTDHRTLRTAQCCRLPDLFWPFWPPCTRPPSPRLHRAPPLQEPPALPQPQPQAAWPHALPSPSCDLSSPFLLLYVLYAPFEQTKQLASRPAHAVCELAARAERQFRPFCFRLP